MPFFGSFAGYDKPWQQMEPEKKPSFFGQGGTGRNIAGYLGDYLSRLGGGSAIYAPLQQQRELMDYKTQQSAAERQQELRDWYVKHGIEQADKTPETIEVDGIVLDKRTMRPVFESPYPKTFQGPGGGFSVQPRIGIQGLQNRFGGQGQQGASAITGEADIVIDPRTKQKLKYNPQTDAWEPMMDNSIPRGNPLHPGY